jgi:hypothetical protein
MDCLVVTMTTRRVTSNPRNGANPPLPVATFEQGDSEAVEKVTKGRAALDYQATDVPKQARDATNNEGDETSTGVIINMTRDMSTISRVVVTISTRLVTG